MVEDRAVSTLPRGARAEEVRKRLEAAIRAGEFGLGDQLPSERQLVERFGVSRLSVREGVKGLIGMGLVEARHGAGYFVVGGISERYRDAFASWLTVHANDLIDTYEVRGALMTLAARRALRRDDPEALAPILEAHQALIDAVAAGADGSEIAALDVRFHTSIAEASGSPLVTDLLRELYDRMAAEPSAAIMGLAGHSERSAREHQAIVDAMLAGSADAVARAVDAHIASVCSTIRSHASAHNGQ